MAGLSPESTTGSDNLRHGGPSNYKRQTRTVVAIDKDGPSGLLTEGGFSDASTPTRQETLLPAFGWKQPTHLPTPQSPKIQTYGNGRPSSPESPLLNGSLLAHAPLLAPVPLVRRTPYLPLEGANSVPPLSRSAQIMTPESSPTLHALDISQTSKSLADRTPRANATKTLESDSIVAPRTPVIASPPSTHSSERSLLSSPFMAKLTIADPSSTSKRRSSHSQSPPAIPTDSEDVFLARPSETSYNGLASDLVYHHQLLATEYDRTRMVEQSHPLDTDCRRPDYMKRVADRSLSNADIPAKHAMDLQGSTAAMARLGIYESPKKGRRLQLFQETSEESFEESLMAGGYPKYGTTSGYDAPRTPGLNQRTIEWLQQSTPGAAGPSNATSRSEPESASDEKALKKRKRLAAFQGCATNGAAPKKLAPVYIEGKGRVLLEAPSEGLPIMPEPSPTKRQKTRRRKQGATGVSSVAGKQGVSTESITVHGPNWPDSQFPWCLRAQERDSIAHAEEEERLRRIAEFLDRDTDSDDSADEEELLASTSWGQVYEDPPLPSRRGRGKMVPLNSNPGTRRRGSHVFFPSDPADARAALLSKKAVRALRYRHQHPEEREGSEEDEEEVVCVCQGRNDGESVQCDGCQTWYHLRCIGIKDVSELGREEDPWFCEGCLSSEDERTPSPEPLPSSEPTFVPTEERGTPGTPKDPLFFEASIQESPMTQWSPSRPPRTPIRGHADGFSSLGADLSKVEPSTPSRGMAIFNTPNNLDYRMPEEPLFDPMSTPSRGLKPVFTPKSSNWSSRGPFHTPGRNTDMNGGARLSFAALGGSGDNLFASPTRTTLNFEDTPVRRTRTSEGSRSAATRRLLDSPWNMRLGRPLRALIDGSSSPIHRRSTQPQRDTPQGSSLPEQ